MNRPSPIRAAGWISIPVSAREKYAIARGSDRHARAVQRVGDAVREQRVHARPGGEDLGGRDARGRGVALARRGDVAPQLAGDRGGCAQAEHAPQGYRAAVRAVGAARTLTAQSNS